MQATDKLTGSQLRGEVCFDHPLGVAIVVFGRSWFMNKATSLLVALPESMLDF